MFLIQIVLFPHSLKQLILNFLRGIEKDSAQMLELPVWIFVTQNKKASHWNAFCRKVDSILTAIAYFFPAILHVKSLYYLFMCKF